MISLYAPSKKIYARSVKGIFNTWRWALVWITQIIIFYGLPWLVWNNRQAVLFDLDARRFYLFGLVLYPRDFIYLTGLLVIAALSLFLFTAVAGRLWCGYACPQTVWTEIFMWFEKVIEGDRARASGSMTGAVGQQVRPQGAQARSGSCSRSGPASPSSAASRRSGCWSPVPDDWA